jgi:uncharacterized membrane protein
MLHHEGARDPDARMVDRMLLFSDAVFAIVLTLLVLELRPPEGGDQGDAALWTALGAQIGHFFSFAISFALVGLWWSLHMRLMRTLATFDWPVAICNLIFLFTIALMPFAAGFWGTHIRSGAALAVYWSANTAASLTFMFVFLAATRGNFRLLVSPMSRGDWVVRLIGSLSRTGAFGAGAWLATLGQVYLSWFAWAAIPIVMVTVGLARRLAAPRAAKGRAPKPAPPAPA